MHLKTLLPAGGCKGKTKKGTNCQSRDVFENGFCKHHGGAGKSLTHRRAVLRVQLDQQKAQKWERRMQKWARRNPGLRRILDGLKARKEAQKCAMDVSESAVQADSSAQG